MEDMSTLRSELGYTVCSDFSDSIEDNGVCDSFEKLFEESTGPTDGLVKVDRDDFGKAEELHQKVYFDRPSKKKIAFFVNFQNFNFVCRVHITQKKIKRNFYEIYSKFRYNKIVDIYTKCKRN